ncbi:hypothetical protein PUNSTDRAFT_78135 [Punctularia strigosozonata HHB-11173 SS5]|uniref:Uncharacterized protein n=1 Tax=Punctularia strigosozonata (strain HHB-11173) TaxID=741275 RepID=R7S0T6_PUNST|nr:uncharacterized protein PUNSTDRAFT_78135 [Punctularia strigosozonata HHB-11173 SS5]EIN03464.1 hypothetical protein PUNSTDRAFT_78135 [Punctularia strigosozonata HHB-11173 SS5]
MNSSQQAALAILASYFIVILTLFSLIFATIPWRNNGNTWRRCIFMLLTTASLAHTWYYMFAFMKWSFDDYESSHLASTSSQYLERIANWLVDTALFEQAWARVCAGPLNWWWSEQICIYTAGAWTVFLVVEGTRHDIKHVWAYMFLGQVVAISVASNVFYLALLYAKSSDGPVTAGQRAASSHSRATSRSQGSGILVLCTSLSLVTVALTPYLSQYWFLPNLLLMHVLLFIPLLAPGPTSEKRETGLSIRTLYSLVTVLAIFLRGRTVYDALYSAAAVSKQADLLPALWKTLHEHPAQASIGWDVVWTTISFIFWVMSDPRFKDTGLLAMLASPIMVGPVGFLAPATLRCLEESS